MREPGWYWLKIDGWNHRIVGEWKNEEWYLPWYCDGDDVTHVGPKIEQPKEQGDE